MTADEILKIAEEVIAGQWGNGAERVTRLTNAGYDAEVIQKKVNELFNSPASPVVKEVEIDMRGFDELTITLVVD